MERERKRSRAVSDVLGGVLRAIYELSGGAIWGAKIESKRRRRMAWGGGGKSIRGDLMLDCPKMLY